MQMYKIITLGKSFVIMNREICDTDGKCVMKENLNTLPTEEGSVIVVSADMKYDYSASLKACDHTFLPDIYRALMIFLYLVKGLPRADYDIVLEDTDRRIQLPEYCGICGGNVGKCKLLYSKNLDNAENGGLESHIVETSQGNYVLVFCDKPDTVDLGRIVSHALTEASPAIALRGALAVSLSGNEAHIASRSLDGSALPDTSAYAASCFMIDELLGITPSTIKSGKLIAKCESGPLGVSVYDLSPKIYKLF